jgi:hypothetical protein
MNRTIRVKTMAPLNPCLEIFLVMISIVPKHHHPQSLQLFQNQREVFPLFNLLKIVSPSSPKRSPVEEESPDKLKKSRSGPIQILEQQNEYQGTSTGLIPDNGWISTKKKSPNKPSALNPIDQKPSKEFIAKLKSSPNQQVPVVQISPEQKHQTSIQRWMTPQTPSETPKKRLSDPEFKAPSISPKTEISPPKKQSVYIGNEEYEIIDVDRMSGLRGNAKPSTSDKFLQTKDDTTTEFITTSRKKSLQVSPIQQKPGAKITYTEEFCNTITEPDKPQRRSSQLDSFIPPKFINLIETRKRFDEFRQIIFEKNNFVCIGAMFRYNSTNFRTNSEVNFFFLILKL